MAYVDITCADGRPIQELSRLIELRSKWLNETAEQSCAACMIDVLVSLRALTAVAKPNKKEINVEASGLVPSFYGGKSNPKFCLRNGKARYTLKTNERIGHATADWKNCKVWKWKDDARKRIWYIVAHSSNEAAKWALEKVKKRAQRFKGLARIAFSILMKQTGSKTSAPITNVEAASKASRLTRVTKTKSGSNYSISANDMLDYAKLALRGGDSAINQALGKASNKIASVINQKCKKILMFEKLDTPFPELRSNK